MRSRTGCLTCRQRKLKCDEKKPRCGQCNKASRACVPSSGLVFRHQHNASMNGEDTSEKNALRGFYAYKNTFDEDTVWLDIPKHVTFLNTTNPYLDPLTPEFDTMSPVSMDSPAGFEHLPVTAWPSSTSMPPVSRSPSTPRPDLAAGTVTSAPLQPMHSGAEISPPRERVAIPYSSPTPSVATPISPPMPLTNHHLNSLLSHGCMTPQSTDPGLSPPFDPTCDRISRLYSMSQRTPSSPSEDFLAEQSHEIAFLLRWFSEGPAYWMDLFDLGTYFSSYVPVKARENALLKYAAVAYSAKSLARVQGRKPIVGGNVTHQARMELYPETQSVDWYHKAAQYYDTAVSLLLQALKNDAVITPEESESEGRQQSYSMVDGRGHKRRRVSSNSTFKSNADEILAASAILCVYEFLDASVPEWAKHLNGAKSLLIIAQERIMPLQMPTPNSTILSANTGFISKARRATFWNIARQDMLAAFINKTNTRFDTEDLSLWKEAGLLIDENGFIIPSNTSESGYPEGEGTMKEDLICNALVWLMGKLVNFMAAGDDLSMELRGSWTGVPQRTLLSYWHRLRQQFQTWYDGLPITFQPCARVDASQTPGRLLQGRNDTVFPEIWYSIPMCASTMQCYHMSQIQLLMNKPHQSTQGPTTVFARLNSYQSVLASCQLHSREIVGISLARSDEAVRIHSVQPLFTAGQCLSDPREREVALNLLRDIETDIGWATDYRVKQLIEQWQYEEIEESHLT
ncbi:hypothetical protein CC78DRAFT_610863 [Lojkania enalia]|uniref:Zn(2)-C6 fungal-type domain-containing protein n=1 Tax=Lojkania enalia TaxID=147567 RepID=A0A9P4TRB8_9PLEO|nr:hypothetical protein CC78DRAFT_610863 [Didymosphaeria enalia]